MNGDSEEAPVGVLLMAYGTPQTLEEVEPYYLDIRRGRTPPPELLAELVDRYRRAGGKTPLLEVSRAQAQGLQRVLSQEFRVFLGMKHWHPYIRHAMAEMQAAGISRAVGVVLAPHYSRGSTGEYVQRVEQAKADLQYDLDINIVPSWHLNPHYLNAVESRIREALTGFSGTENVTVVFTAHSLPQRAVSAGDPYERQLLETSGSLAGRLGLDDDEWTFSYQSAGRTSDPWLGPDIHETVERLADRGVRRILVTPIGFIADHLEILYDIDQEARSLAQGRGVQLERIRSLNDDPGLISALEDVVRAQAGKRT